MAMSVIIIYSSSKSDNSHCLLRKPPFETKSKKTTRKSKGKMQRGVKNGEQTGYRKQEPIVTQVFRMRRAGCTGRRPFRKNDAATQLRAVRRRVTSPTT